MQVKWCLIALYCARGMQNLQYSIICIQQYNFNISVPSSLYSVQYTLLHDLGNGCNMPHHMYYYAIITTMQCRVERNSEFSAINSCTCKSVGYSALHCSVKFWVWKLKESQAWWNPQLHCTLHTETAHCTQKLLIARRNCSLHTETAHCTQQLDTAYINCRLNKAAILNAVLYNILL